MIQFPSCKINIGLHITQKRTDGYHNIETIFYNLPMYDVLELQENVNPGITLLGNPIPGSINDNIVIKAYELVKKDYPQLPPVHFTLLKNIPIGAGLGAGSANGAFALKGLNQLYNLQLSTNDLLRYALQLGSDCPFFIINTPCYAGGRGEELQELLIDLSEYKIVVVNPRIHISTPWAFSQITPSKPNVNLAHIVTLPLAQWKYAVQNDFEKPVFDAYPEIAAIKKGLYKAGALFALMSGSGSSVYGIFEKQTLTDFNFNHNYFVKIIG